MFRHSGQTLYIFLSEMPQSAWSISPQGLLDGIDNMTYKLRTYLSKRRSVSAKYIWKIPVYCSLFQFLTSSVEYSVDYVIMRDYMP
jgi:hypothetical protein